MRHHCMTVRQSTGGAGFVSAQTGKRGPAWLLQAAFCPVGAKREG